MCVCVHMCVLWPSMVSYPFTPARCLEDLLRVQYYLHCCGSKEVPKESANTGKLICYEGFYIKLLYEP